MPFIPCPPLARFQFTPLREGRRLTPDEMGELTDYFNSRPSARGDVSASRSSLWHHEFQFTPLREGRRGPGMSMHSFDSLFQFTPLREGRPGGRHARAAVRYFNSRPSARGDGAGKVIGECRIISIHAPPRGATAVDAVQYEHPQDYFNSRPSARGDGGADVSSVPRFLFQFTPLREGRRQQIRGAGDE